jgi:hypothetical protein
MLKYLGINLMKEAKDLYNENHKSLKRRLKKTLEQEKMFHAHRLAESI